MGFYKHSQDARRPQGNRPNYGEGRLSFNNQYSSFQIKKRIAGSIALAAVVGGFVYNKYCQEYVTQVVSGAGLIFVISGLKFLDYRSKEKRLEQRIMSVDTKREGFGVSKGLPQLPSKKNERRENDLGTHLFKGFERGNDLPNYPDDRSGSF